MAAVIADASAGADADALPARRGKKKIIVIGAGVLALLLALGGGTTFYLKQRAARAAAAAEEDGGATLHAQKLEPKSAPLYLPLDPFVVNLADKEADRYAQIGITFELDSGVSADQIKAYMPAIRNAVLMIIAHKTSRELLDRTGKEQLAEEITREALRPMGIEMAGPESVPTPVAVKLASPAASGAASGSVANAASGSASAVAGEEAKPRAAKRRIEARNPIQHVHFSSFIIQ